MRRKWSHSALVLALLVWSAGWSLAGWGLSLLGGLSFATCSVVLVGILGGSIAAGRAGAAWGPHGGWIRLRRFARCHWAKGYLLLLLLSVAGSLLYAPGNIDGLSYRLPRLFHWVDAGRWHWIDTDNLRMNVTAPGFEWLSLPAWAIFQEPKLMVLPNLLAYALLPGLTFSVLRGLRVSGRVARRWMWLLPTGYGYLLQAGSIGNDLIGAIYFFAALDLAWRARRLNDHGGSAFAGSMLGMALSTGIKMSNAPLGLVWLVAARPSLGWLRTRLGVVGLIVAVLASGAVSMALNHQRTRDISGDPGNLLGAKPSSPVIALAANSLLFTSQNFLPPVFPLSSAWNGWTSSLMKGPFASLHEGFPRMDLRANEMAQEEWAGLGVMLVLLAVHGRWGRSRGRRPAWTWRSEPGALVAAGWIALGIYGATIASEMPGRLLLPYYPILLGAILGRTPPQGAIDSRLHRAFAAVTILLAATVLALGPARPLWPWRPVLEKLAAKKPNSPFIARANKVYSVYAARPDHLAELRTAWPAEEKVIGFIGTADDSEVSLWQPYGQRRVLVATHLTGLLEAGRPHPLRYLVTRLGAVSPAVEAEFLAVEKAGQLERVFDREITVKASAAPEHWVVWRRTASPPPVPAPASDR